MLSGSNVVNIILVSGQFSVHAEDDAPEEGVKYEEGEREEEPNDVGQVHVTPVIVSEEDGEGDDDWENETAEGNEAVEDEPGEEGCGVVRESPTHQDTVDGDGQQRKPQLTRQRRVSLPGLAQLGSVPALWRQEWDKRDIWYV